MTATHGRPHDLSSICGLRLAIRKATVPERLLDVCLGGYLFTCPKHGPVYVEVFLG